LAWQVHTLTLSLCSPTLRHLADLRTVKTAARDSTGAQRFAQRPVDWSVLGSLS
jgi:hypothetical protein